MSFVIRLWYICCIPVVYDERTVAVIIKCHCKKKEAGALRKSHLLLHFSPLVLLCELALCNNNTRKRCALGVAHLSPFPSTRLLYIFVSYSDARLFQTMRKKQNKYISNSSIIVVVYTQRALKQMTTRANGDLSSPPLSSSFVVVVVAFILLIIVIKW